MKCLSLLALCSLLVLIPSCRNNGPTTTPVEVEETGTVEVQEEVAETEAPQAPAPEASAPAPVSDKESLEEDELAEVMEKR